MSEKKKYKIPKSHNREGEGTGDGVLENIDRRAKTQSTLQNQEEETLLTWHLEM
jgi:hypothetical protein